MYIRLRCMRIPRMVALVFIYLGRCLSVFLLGNFFFEFFTFNIFYHSFFISTATKDKQQLQKNVNDSYHGRKNSSVLIFRNVIAVIWNNFNTLSSLTSLSLPSSLSLCNISTFVQFGCAFWFYSACSFGRIFSGSVIVLLHLTCNRNPFNVCAGKLKTR